MRNGNIIEDIMLLKNILLISWRSSESRMNGATLYSTLCSMLWATMLVLALLGFGTQNSADDEKGSVAKAKQGSDQGAGSNVVVEEYLSLTCPHCADFHRKVYPGLAKGVLRDKRVVFLYRDFPLDSLSLRAAVLARCGGEDLRAKLIGAMLERQHKWLRDPDPQARLFAIVALVGIDRVRAQACLENKALERAVLEEQLAGQKRYKISSTPTFVVAGNKLSGALSEKSITRAIEENL